MPLVRLKSIWTPLMLVGIKLLKDDYGAYYIKVWGSDLKKLG
ncbi:hypothetical protein [Alkalihalobacillus hemicellulosilyticus]|nr:hypothetical protein [Halalkalibacter hemicellulosilyticus]